ncbi:MAG TPA: helix-turn-helix domain-containing protein [Rhizomicrobium sp.]|nr:helix-turn-helix domain-containing protein [Rhizomicrobium sp.]
MKKTAGLTQADYRALALFRHMLRQFLAFSETAAEAAGLTPVQHQALLAIKGMPGEGDAGESDVSVGDLAAWLGIRHHSCVGLADRLVREGLVRRRRDPKDRRRMGLRLTARAERKLAGLSATHRDELRRLSGTLGPLLAALH